MTRTQSPGAPPRTALFLSACPGPSQVPVTWVGYMAETVVPGITEEAWRRKLPGPPTLHGISAL